MRSKNNSALVAGGSREVRRCLNKTPRIGSAASTVAVAAVFLPSYNRK